MSIVNVVYDPESGSSSSAASGGELERWVVNLTNGQQYILTREDIHNLGVSWENTPDEIAEILFRMYSDDERLKINNEEQIKKKGKAAARAAARAEKQRVEQIQQDQVVALELAGKFGGPTLNTRFGGPALAQAAQGTEIEYYYEQALAAANAIADKSFQHENTNTIQDGEIYLLRSNSNQVVNGLVQFVLPNASQDVMQDAITMIDDVQTNLDNVEKIYKNTKNYINVFGELLDPTWTPWINIFGEEKILYCLLFGIELPVEKYIEELEKMSGGVGSTDKNEKREWRLTFLRMMIYILNADNSINTRRTDVYGSSPLNDYFKRMLGYFNGNPFVFNDNNNIKVNERTVTILQIKEDRTVIVGYHNNNHIENISIDYLKGQSSDFHVNGTMKVKERTATFLQINEDRMSIKVVYEDNKNVGNISIDYLTNGLTRGTSGIGHSGIKIGKPCCGIWAGGNIITSYAKLLLNIINHDKDPPEPLDGINATPGFKESILYQRILNIINTARDKNQLISEIERVAAMSYSDLDCNGCIIVEDDTRLQLFTDANNSNRDPQLTGNHYYGIDDIRAAKAILKANLTRLGIVIAALICGFYLFRIKNKIPFKVSEKYDKLKTSVKLINSELSISDKNIANGLVACGIDKLFPGGAEKATLDSLKSNAELKSKLMEYYFKHLLKKKIFTTDKSFMEKIMDSLINSPNEPQRGALYYFLKQKHDVTYRKLENDILSDDKWYNSKLDKKTRQKTVNKTRMNMGKKILSDHCRFLTDVIINNANNITGNVKLRTEFVAAYTALSAAAHEIDRIKNEYDTKIDTYKIVIDYNTLSQFLSFSQDVHLTTISVWRELNRISEATAIILRGVVTNEIGILNQSLTLIQTKISELAELSITDRTNRQLTPESHANYLTFISNAHSRVENSLKALADKYAIFLKIFESISDEQTLFDTLSLARYIFKIFSENDIAIKAAIENEKSVIRDITKDWITDYYELNVLTLNTMITGYENTNYIAYLNQNPHHPYFKYATDYLLSCEQFYELILLQKKYNNALTAFNVSCTIKIMKDKLDADTLKIMKDKLDAGTLDVGTLGVRCTDLRAITSYLNMMMQDFTKNITISETNQKILLNSMSSLHILSKSELPKILTQILSSYLKHDSTKPILDFIKETIKTSGLQVDDENPLVIYEDAINIETNKTIGNSIRSIPSESSCVSINPSNLSECKEINNSSITMSAELKLLIAEHSANDLQGLTSTSNYIITRPNTFDDVDLADAVEDGCRIDFTTHQNPWISCGVGGGKMRRKIKNNRKIKKTKKNKKPDLKNTKNKKAQNRKTKQQKQPKQKISKKRNKM